MIEIIQTLASPAWDQEYGGAAALVAEKGAQDAQAAAAASASSASASAVSSANSASDAIDAAAAAQASKNGAESAEVGTIAAITGAGGTLGTITLQAADRTVLAALDTSTGLSAKLLEPGFDGDFFWDGSDLSAKVAADSDHEDYVAPTGMDGSTGAWVREDGFRLAQTLKASSTLAASRIHDGDIWVPADATSHSTQIANDPDEKNVKASTFNAAKIWLRKSFLNRDYVKPEDFIATGDTYDRQALGRMCKDGRPVRLIRQYITDDRIDLPTTIAVTILGDGDRSGIMLSSALQKIILYLQGPRGEVLMKDFYLDANGGGQLDGGLLQINGATVPFLLDNLRVRNGLTADVPNGKGVNGIAFATTAYPGGAKCKGMMRSCIADSFSKAPFNVTTFAEEVWLVTCEATNSVGNGSCPAFQINGGRKTHLLGCKAIGTEGAGLAIATVGTVPAYPSSEVIVDDFYSENAGQLGSHSNFGNGIIVTDSSSSPAGSDTTCRVQIGLVRVKNSYGPALNVSTWNGRFNMTKMIVDGCNSAVTVDASSNVDFGEVHARNANQRALTGVGVVFLRGASNVRGKIFYTNLADSTAPNLIHAITANSSNIEIESRWTGALANYPVSQDVPGRLRSSRITWNHETALAAGATHNAIVFNVADGAVAALRMEAVAYGATQQAQQSQIGTARSTSGAASLVNLTSLSTYKSAGIATGLIVDATGNALRGRFLGASGEATTVRINAELVIG